MPVGYAAKTEPVLFQTSNSISEPLTPVQQHIAGYPTVKIFTFTHYIRKIIYVKANFLDANSLTATRTVG